MKNKAIYVISLGCAKNLVDTEVMCGAFITAGYYLSANENLADICLINTCGFIQDARDESYDSIEWALEWKSEKPGRLVVVAGCLAQRQPQDLAAKYPQIDMLIGLDQFPRLPELLDKLEKGKQTVHVDGALPTYLYDHSTPRLTLTAPSFAYVKVAEGCDHRCAYCAIPLIRGRQRSRTMDSVLEECHQLLDQGARELNFIAQDTSRYGTDIGTDLETLLRKCDAIEGDFWIRVLYTHPLHLTPGLVDALGNSRHVVPYLDIPLQHISDGVLKSMGRGMTGEKTRALLQGIREKYPRINFRTTFMVGFPGETDRDFEELLSFVKEFRFNRLGVFCFSPEEGTPAASLKDGLVPAEIAEERRAEILDEQLGISLENNQGLVGKTVRLLLDSQISKRTWEARTEGDAPEVDQVVEVSTRRSRQPAETGFVDAVVTGASQCGLIANEVAAPAKAAK